MTAKQEFLNVIGTVVDWSDRFGAILTAVQQRLQEMALANRIGTGSGVHGEGDRTTKDLINS